MSPSLRTSFWATYLSIGVKLQLSKELPGALPLLSLTGMRRCWRYGFQGLEPLNKVYNFTVYLLEQGVFLKQKPL